MVIKGFASPGDGNRETPKVKIETNKRNKKIAEKVMEITKKQMATTEQTPQRRSDRKT